MCMHFCLLYGDAHMLVKLCKNAQLRAASLYVYGLLSVILRCLPVDEIMLQCKGTELPVYMCTDFCLSYSDAHLLM